MKRSDHNLSSQATDSDAGANGQVRYRIVNHPDLFVIGANGSIYTKVPLDREQRSQYDLVVEASDGAVDPRRTTLTLSVQVTDIDDNSPVFSQQTYVVSVPENSPVGTVVLKLSVSTHSICMCLFVSLFPSLSNLVRVGIFKVIQKKIPKDILVIIMLK